MDVETLDVFEDKLLLFCRDNGFIQLLDASASMLWKATELGMTAEEIYEALPGDNHRILSLQYIRDLQEGWKKQGLLRKKPLLEYCLYLCPGVTTVALKTNSLDIYEYVKDNYSLCLNNNPDEDLQTIEAVWMEHQAEYMIKSSRSKPYTCKDIDKAASSVSFEISELAIHEYPRLFIAHAAAVAGSGNTILIPARAGSGKSTLTASLLLEGYKLINDDIVPVNPDGSISVLNLPLKIKSGAWDILTEQYPDLGSQNHIIRFGDTPMKLLSVSAESCCRAGSIHIVDTILIPEYAPEKQSALKQLTPAQALVPYFCTSIIKNKKIMQPFSEGLQ